MQASNLRTFENARKLRLNLCQLNAMGDDELAEELRIANLSFPVREVVKVKPSFDKSIDIRKVWQSASKQDKGVRPYGGISHLIR